MRRGQFAQMVVLGLTASLAVAFGGGCSSPATMLTSDSATPVARASASATPSNAPPRVEITTAIRKLIRPLLKSGQIAKITVYDVGRDARGHRTARAYLTPPRTASCWPSKILVVQRPSGWKTVSVTTDHTFGGTATPGPGVVLNDVLELDLL
jgi:hypothetical protein